MTKKLLVSFCLLSGLSFGQSFTAANEFLVGESQTMYMCDSAAPSYANVTGTGVTWDYSNYVKVNNAERLYSVTANTNTAAYPSSNKVVTIENVLTTMYATDATERNVVGLEYISGSSFLGTVVMNFESDNIQVMDYDFSLNEEISDPFAGTMASNGGNSSASGTSFSEVDGIGTLILTHTVTRTNVIRHHQVDTINTTIFFQNVRLIIDQYNYYDFVDNNLPLFAYVNVRIIQNGSTELSNMNFVLNSEDPLVFVGLNEEANADFRLSPNPAADKLQLTGESLDGSEQFRILDISGKSVLNSASAHMDISSLLPGVYFVRIEKDGAHSLHKFIKK